MNKRTSLSLFGGGLAVPAGPPKAPERLCLWKPGKTFGDFGVIRWDAQAATQVWESYRRRGNPLRIDVEHNTNPQLNPSYDANRPPEGAGYAFLKMVAGPKGQELWLDPIQWSDYGRQQIESGSRRCLSPEWVPDPKSDRPVELIAVSLVQSPGTYQMGLMASQRAASGARKMDQAMLIAAIEAALTSDDVKAAIEALLAKVKEISPAADVVEPVEEFSSADVPEEKKELAQLIASMRAIVNGPKKVASSVAAKPGVTLDAVRREIQAVYREEGAKAQLIASAKASPMYTEAFGQELQTLPLTTVKRLVQTMPKATAAATTEQATQVASAQKVAQLPGANPSKEELTPGEEEAIDLIKKASVTRNQHIAEAQTASAKPSEDGTGSFSYISQMTPRQAQKPKAS